MNPANRVRVSVESPANIKAVETKCGFKPFFRYNNDNYTIGKDGWSIHPFHECSGQVNSLTLTEKPTPGSMTKNWRETKIPQKVNGKNNLKTFT